MLTPIHYIPKISRVTLYLLCSGALFLLGCPTDTAPLKQENLQLKKQTAKLESVVLSLQEGNKVTQQQIDLLNREARKTQEHYEDELKKADEKIKSLSQGSKVENGQLQTLEQENIKLRGDARWLRSQREHMRKGLKTQKNGGNAKNIDSSFLSVIDTAQLILTKNGYTVLASMQTDQKAAFITNRKTSPPASLEVTGFRNQYILTVDKQSEHSSRLWVKADFEKLSQQRQLIEASQNEIKEIETRLIQEIQQILKDKSPKPGLPQKK